MTWTQTMLDDLVAVGKDLSDKLGELVVQDLTLGKDVNHNLDYLLLIEDILFGYLTLGKDVNHNLDYLLLIEDILFGLEYGTEIYQDEHYAYAAEMVNRISSICFKYV